MPALWLGCTAGSLLGLMLLASCASVPAAPEAAQAAPAPVAPSAQVPAAVVAWGGPRAYEVEELTPIINRALKAGGRDFERGKKIFDDLNCALCHHFGGGAGGIGPDISGVGGRMGTDGILREIIEPSTYISDLFGTKTVTTTNGETFTGRMVANDATQVTLVPAFTIDPTTRAATWDGVPPIRIKPADVESIEESGVSPMPPGMINGLKEDEVADLLAFLISGGDPANRMFKPAASPPR